MKRRIALLVLKVLMPIVLMDGCQPVSAVTLPNEDTKIVQEPVAVEATQPAVIPTGTPIAGEQVKSFPIPPGSPVTEKNWILVAQAADIVVAGAVKDIRSYHGTNPFGWKLILSDVTVDRLTVLKGKEVKQLTFTVEGGTVGDITAYVSSAPQLQIGVTYVLLLKSDQKRKLWIFGTDFGALPLTKEKQVQALDTDLTKLHQALRGEPRR